MSPALVVAALIALFAVVTVLRTVRIVPQARARNVERLGRYCRTLGDRSPGTGPACDRQRDRRRHSRRRPSAGIRNPIASARFPAAGTGTGHAAGHRRTP